MRRVRILALLIVPVSLALAALAVSCTIVENVTIRPPDYPGGSTHIFGEVKNDSAVYATWVTVNGSLLDSTGTVVATPTFWVCPLVIKPYDTIATGTYYSGEASIANYDLKVESIPKGPLPDAALSISDLQVIENEYGNLGIKGVITNTGAERYEHVMVCAAFYDSQGKPDAFLLDYAPDVGPGQRAVFDLFSSPFGGEPSERSVAYRLWVQPTGGTSFMDRGYVSTEKTPF